MNLTWCHLIHPGKYDQKPLMLFRCMNEYCSECRHDEEDMYGSDRLHESDVVPLDYKGVLEKL